MAIPQGTRLGHYEIRTLLGAGGMGEVYLADDLSLHRPVAVKVLRADLLTNEDGVQRFEREAYAASSLNHPNILTVYEIGTENESHFIVTEFIEGESLGRRLHREPIKLLEVVRVGIQVASALSAAHAAGIIHRDIKPDNIMLRRDHVAKVLDFGLAKLSEQAGAALDPELRTKVLQATIPGMLMGTARYMSPEQARGEVVDARTDIWSFGVVLYQMVAGHLPFAGKTMSDVLAAVLRADPPALTAYVPGVPVELDRIVTKALRKDPDQRYQSIKDLELDLKTLKQHLEFETELERSGGAKRISLAELRAKQRVTEPASTPTDREVSHVQTTSTAEYLVSEIRRHKRGALLILASVVALTIAGAYFAYTRYSASRRAGITSLAVLPFVNTSNDPEKEYLSDGISESLINRLSQLPGIKVIANTSSSKYKGKNPDPLDVARALDVGAVLTGRVLQHGDDLSISVELVDARDRTQLWGEQYNRKATDLLSVQEEISREIAEMLRLRLTASQQQQRIGTREQVNPQAYELLLKGRFYRSRGGTDDRKKAAEYFNQAIAMDPAYALAYAELSITYWSLVTSSALNPKEYSPKAEALALKALELNENLAEGYYALANLKTDAWEWANAEAKYKRAIELNPNLALAHRWYANFLTLMGRHEQAIGEIKRARELDPLSLPINAIVGFTFYEARQYDQAIEALKKTLELDRNFPYAHLFLGYTDAAKGMYPEAIAEYLDAIRLGHDTPSRQIFLGAAYAGAGDRRQAEGILKRLQTSKEYVSPGELAVLYGALGERDQAFASLEKAYEAHDLQLQYLGVSPTFDPLRSDPRFQDLLRRVGLRP
jgi:serine/threonine protein kinase/Tfp pilus assembly protein PilF